MVVDDVVVNLDEDGQRENVTIGHLLFLDSGEDAVTEMVLLLHSTALAGEGLVGLSQYKGRQPGSCSH